ncbi:hypothetical protein SLS62_000813 [Diatrype stigma]|uniref:UFSP1/2/DUB catalytic domain-containing protein n=1 Tax=Diatrype stigma TaxID=117547 RepID=A0AAN9YWR4_9PEZI
MGRSEGGFCGYRNIQMMASYIVGSGGPGADRLHGRVPSIFRIQDYIEAAWDAGINAHGRVETGGVKGTRKYIGTSEASFSLLLIDVYLKLSWVTY